MCGAMPSVAELVVRPTGIVDPAVRVVNCSEMGGYEDHLLGQIEVRRAAGEYPPRSAAPRPGVQYRRARCTVHSTKKGPLLYCTVVL